MMQLFSIIENLIAYMAFMKICPDSNEDKTAGVHTMRQICKYSQFMF